VVSADLPASHSEVDPLWQLFTRQVDLQAVYDEQVRIERAKRLGGGGGAQVGSAAAPSENA
jgi:hypothetical protein